MQKVFATIARQSRRSVQGSLALRCFSTSLKEPFARHEQVCFYFSIVVCQSTYWSN